MSKTELIPCSSDQELAQRAASEWLSQLPPAGPAPYLVALSGGRIAKNFFAAIAAQAKSRNLSHIHWFWADERCVPPEHPESNFLLAQNNLFEPLALPPQQVHRIPGEDLPPRAAQRAAQEICRFSAGNTLPKLDIVFLGMGEDGHVASLFPSAPQEASNAIYYPVVASKPPPNRITISYALLAAAAEVWVLASGAGKENALARSLSENGTIPLAKVIKSRAKTRIFTDINASLPRFETM